MGKLFRALPPYGAAVDVCDKRGFEYSGISQGVCDETDHLVVKDVDTGGVWVVCEWKYPFEGTGAWRQ